MQLAARLTAGWADLPRSPFSAKALHNKAVVSGHYEKSLFHQLQTIPPDTNILGLDALFRQTCGGFEPIAQFVRALAMQPVVRGNPTLLLCEIDLFAYTFLSGLNNFDLLLPLSQHTNVELAQVKSGCEEALSTLENFERSGTLPKRMSELDAQQYLAVRRIIVRPTAHTERKALATLLISGPSTASNLERELNIPNHAAQQTLFLFESIGLLTRWGEEPGYVGNEPVFVIDKVAIPLVLFCLKETLGLDLLGNLSSLLDASYD